jgi:putative transposase
MAGRHDMDHVRGTRHIIREGKIERWHQTLKNRILLESYNLPGDLGTLIEAFAAVHTHPSLLREQLT